MATTPDYTISVQYTDPNSGTTRWHAVGAIWINPNGLLNIYINPLVQIPVGPTRLTGFPKDYKPAPKQPAQPSTPPKYVKPISQRVRDEIKRESSASPDDLNPF